MCTNSMLFVDLASKRRHMVTVNITGSEHFVITKEAEARGMTMAGFMREMLRQGFQAMPSTRKNRIMFLDLMDSDLESISEEAQLSGVSMQDLVGDIISEKAKEFS